MATSTPAKMVELYGEYELDADGYDTPNRTVVVHRDDSVCSLDGVQALAERNGYFVFAVDAREVTLAAYADADWKSN